MKDYSRLKGKEIIIKFNGKENKCFVAEIDKSKGIFSVNYNATELEVVQTSNKLNIIRCDLNG